MCLTCGEMGERVRKYLCTPLIHQQLKLFNSISHCEVVSECVCVCAHVCVCVCVHVCVCVCVFVECTVHVECVMHSHNTRHGRRPPSLVLALNTSALFHFH